MKAEIEKLLFSPGEDIEELIISEIDKAKEKLIFMVFWFTWKPIAEAIIRAKSRGVEVKLILDSRSTEQKVKDFDEEKETIIPNFLIKNSIPKENIRIYSGELLHHKVILIDEEKILTGTCNFFNASINRHEEHYMLIRNRELYNIFFERFSSLWINNAKTI